VPAIALLWFHSLLKFFLNYLIFMTGMLPLTLLVLLKLLLMLSVFNSWSCRYLKEYLSMWTFLADLQMIVFLSGTRRMVFTKSHLDEL